MGVAAELGDSLSDEDIEPVERLGLVTINIVICLVENGGYGEGGRIA